MTFVAELPFLYSLKNMFSNGWKGKSTYTEMVKFLFGIPWELAVLDQGSARKCHDWTMTSYGAAVDGQFLVFLSSMRTYGQRLFVMGEF